MSSARHDVMMGAGGVYVGDNISAGDDRKSSPSLAPQSKRTKDERCLTLGAGKVWPSELSLLQRLSMVIMLF